MSSPQSRPGFAFALFLLPTFIFLITHSAQAQYAPSVPYTFTGSADGASPAASLIFDSKGNVYGTAAYGGDTSGANCTGANPPIGCGIVFELTPPPSGSGPWTQTVLYTFTGGSDGAYPESSLTFDSQGNLYGTTSNGGDLKDTICLTLGGCGVVFELTPPKSGSGPWTETPIYTFTAGNDGSVPYSNVIFDSKGNLYGTAAGGGTGTGGTVFELTPPANGSGPWTETTLWSFTYGDDGGSPVAGLIFDSAGNLYGTTSSGGSGHGVVFELSPPSGGGVPWNETTLFTFNGKAEGGYPYAGVVFDSTGNLYGTTAIGGSWSGTTCKPTDGCGVVYELTPDGSGNPWTEQVLYTFDAGVGGGYPYSGVIFDTNGNLFGTTAQGGDASSPACSSTDGCGVVYELTPGGSGNWSQTPVYAFTGQSDGGFPYAAPLFDSRGNIYGTTAYGGDLTDSNCVDAGGCGVVFELIPQIGPVVTFSPTSLIFAAQTVGTTSNPKTVVVANTGSATLDITSIVASADFAISSSTCGATLAVGKTCKVKVTFTPSGTGPITGTLTFTDNALNSPQTIQLSGTGVAAATLSPASASFGKQKVGTTSNPKKFTLANAQTVTLTGINISTSGDFAVSSTTCASTLGSKQKCLIYVTFTPTKTGARTGQLTVKDSAPNSPQTASLTGTGD
jgi:uncharacterized repeat protein (TIGR03803 family)